MDLWITPENPYECKYAQTLHTGKGILSIAIDK